MFLPTVPDALDVLVPLGLGTSVVTGALAARTVDAVEPGRAVRLLTVAAVTSTVAVGTSCAVVTGVLLVRLPVLAGWVDVRRRALPEPTVSWRWSLPLLLVAVVAVVVLVRHLLTVVRQFRLARDAHREAARRGRLVHGSSWSVLRSGRPDAYALPGRPDRVVVSTAMLDVLDPVQRRVLLAHERSHLAHHHHRWIQLAESASVLNPFLRRLPREVRHAAELQADLDAARAVGDPVVTARAIATAARARSAAARSGPGRAVPGSPPSGLAATGGDVVRRVRFLLHPPVAARGRAGAALLVAVIVFSSVTTAATVYCTVARMDRAVAVGSALPS